jgi:hypothetical protein
MHVLFGPEHDHLHIDPWEPGGYEWWYFDALSDDGKYALVVIFFLGTPMSPYYKAVVDGKNPVPMDWCGVFVSLHELIPAGSAIASPAGVRRFPAEWREIAYAYNILRKGTFATDSVDIGIGRSRCWRDEAGVWHLDLHEKGLWGEELNVALTFTAVGPGIDREPLGGEDGHSWVCVAPSCQVSGVIDCPVRDYIKFVGEGYHDHNFGRLPWLGVEIWYWGRGTVRGPAGRYRLIYYVTQFTDGREMERLLFVFSESGATIRWGSVLEAQLLSKAGGITNGYGLTFAELLRVVNFTEEQVLTVVMGDKNGMNGTRMQNMHSGPFYRRSVGEMEIEMLVQGPHKVVERTSEGYGIHEVFRPARLCHPIWSWLMWTRIRRRPSPLAPLSRSRRREM